MRRTITVFLCDAPTYGGKSCGKEIKTVEDGLILDGHLRTADDKHALRSETPDGGTLPETTAICWGHFHELFPSPQMRAYGDEIARSYERGGPGDR